MGDVPVATDDDLAPVGGGPHPEFLQVGQELAHEPDLLVLPFGPDLARGEVEARDGDTGQVRLDVPPGGVELLGPEADPDPVGSRRV